MLKSFIQHLSIQFHSVKLLELKTELESVRNKCRHFEECYKRRSLDLESTYEKMEAAEAYILELQIRSSELEEKLIYTKESVQELADILEAADEKTAQASCIGEL